MKDTPSQQEFWEQHFQEKQMMWGSEASQSVKPALRLFQERQLQTLLIPGFGYGRNAKAFADHGFDITGIEISRTAIDIAKKQWANAITVHQGDVSDMPFDANQYDGIFCYALLHLLTKAARKKFIDDCYQQLNNNGYMVFVTLATHTPTFAQGAKMDHNTYLSRHGVDLFYHDLETIEQEFSAYGLIEQTLSHEDSQDFWIIVCQKT
ncbi:class I SAM-dependent methyltransferase [Reinekea thalattae]|uniref:Class I SAM-dependent methyltransferase n=1 Tax=Reinekea thalattae TaxID=2593301 RepID=A0A5C8Z819_9GAMM|nr:class I SAM-dependent methyltransferase [Reinekea thalattae]TXR54092.1 class I SAM-dependent methyltransferase [Reinekea thalattae]